MDFSGVDFELSRVDKSTQVFTYGELVHRNKQLIITNKKKMNSKIVTPTFKNINYVQKAVHIESIPQNHFDSINETDTNVEKFISECI